MAVSGATFVTSSRRGALLATAWMLGDRPPSSFLGQFADTLLNNPLGTPALPPKSAKAGPGRPKGTRKPPRTRYPAFNKLPEQAISIRV